MTEIDDLPADQRAVLQLLLKQGQSYEDIAGLLDIDGAAVRERAHGALEALGPDAGRRLAPERRAEVSDYLLGQQSSSAAAATRDHLAASAAARAWARVVASALRPLASKPLPEVPPEGAEEREDEAQAAPAEPEEAAAPAGAAPASATAADAGAGQRRGGGLARVPRSSRLGGALLLGGIGVLIVVIVILLVGGGGSKKDKASTVSSTPTNQTTGQATPVAQINLRPPSGGGKPLGLAQVFAQGNQRLVIVAGQGLSPGAYALWLYSSPSKNRLLGFVPSRVGKDGRFVTQGVLPGDATSFQNIIVTSEQVSGNRPVVPKSPGTIVLQGAVSTG